MSDVRPLDLETLKTYPLPPIEDGDKHSRGRLLIIAGDRGLGGAALLAALGAMRAGAGKLKIATVQSMAPHVSIAMPESMTVGMDEAEGGGLASSAVEPLAGFAKDADAVIAGPGMFPSDACEALAASLLKSGAAVALDAGLLRSLPAREQDAKRAERPAILLPHAGELAALLECKVEEVEHDPVAAGRACADRYDGVTLVKGVQSHIVAPDGTTFLYRGGGPGLAISGSGDTLAGIVGGVLARGADPLTALLWGVWLHGEAGRRLGEKVGTIGYLAREIPDEVPALLEPFQASE